MLRSLSRSTLSSHNLLTFARTSTCRRLLSTSTRAAIQSAISDPEKPLVVFMKGTPQRPECGFSRGVIQILELHGVEEEKLKTYNVLEDAELRSGIKEFSEWPTIPQMYLGGEFVGGCDIVIGMHQSGELEPLLEKHGVIPKLPEQEAEPAS